MQSYPRDKVAHAWHLAFCAVLCCAVLCSVRGGFTACSDGVGAASLYAQSPRTQGPAHVCGGSEDPAHFNSGRSAI